MFSKLWSNILKQFYQKIIEFKDHTHELYYSLKHMPYLEKLSDEREKLTKELKLIKDYQFPFYQYPNLNLHLLKYIISTKNPRDAAFNKSNLMIILGPESVGKTWFIKYNLKSLSNMDINLKPIDIFWDLKCETFMNYDIFFYHFKTLLIETLAKINDTTGKTILTNEIIKKVLYYNYPEEYIEIFARDVIQCLLNDEEEILLDEESKGSLSLVFAEILEKKGKRVSIFKKKFSAVIEIFKKSLEIDSITAYLVFSLLIISKIEHENRPKIYRSSHFFTGIEQTDFLFDIINYMAGYHDENLFLNDPKTYDVQHIYSKYPHFSLLISNFDLLLDSYPEDLRIKDFFDHLLLRLFTTTKCRTHFPVIIESKKSRFFNRTVWEMMHQSEEYIPVIELEGFNSADIPNNLSEIYNIHQIKVLVKVLGGNLSDWHGVTKELLQKGKTLSVWDVAFDFAGDYIEKERRKFSNKISEFYSNIEAYQELDDGTIDFKLLAILEKISSFSYQGGFNVTFAINDIQFLENPIIKALIDINVLYQVKYQPILRLQKKLYLLFVREWVKRKKNQMTYKERLSFFFYKRFKGMDYSVARATRSRFFGRYYHNNRLNFDHEIFSYREKLFLDEDYDKKLEDKKN